MRNRRNRVNRSNPRLKPQEITVRLESNDKFTPSNWLSAIATTGILGMTIWAGFFSDFSKVAEASLRQENTILKADRTSLGVEVEDLSLQKQTLENEVSALKTDLETQTIDYARRERNFARLNDKIETLKSETAEMERVLFESQLTIYQNKLSKNLYTSKLPEFIKAFAEHTQKRIFNSTNDNGEIKPLKNREILEVTFDGMLFYLEDIKLLAKTKVEIQAYNHLRERFEIQCASKETFIQKITSKHNLDLDGDAKSEFLYDILMDEEYACFE